MFCHNCGNKLDDYAIYCESCGVKLKKGQVNEAFSYSEGLNRYYEFEYEMSDIRDKLTTIASKKALLHRLKQSYEQKSHQLQQVRNMMVKEKKDYDSLLKISFASIKARLNGDIDEKTRKEEAEYLDALAKFEHVGKEYADLSNEIANVENEIKRIESLKLRLTEIDKEMEKLLIQLTAGKSTENLSRLEQQYNHFQEELSKINEIQNQFEQADLLLGQAENHLDRALSELRSAEGLGTWDLFFRGGIIVDSMKHGRLNGARNDINHAQSLVRRAKDLVEVVDDLYIDFEAPNLFVDMFFDNFFFDMFGNAKISRTRERAEDSLYQLRNSRNNLTNYLVQWQEKRNNLITELNKVGKLIREERISLLK